MRHLVKTELQAALRTSQLHTTRSRLTLLTETRRSLSTSQPFRYPAYTPSNRSATGTNTPSTSTPPSQPQRPISTPPLPDLTDPRSTPISQRTLTSGLDDEPLPSAPPSTSTSTSATDPGTGTGATEDWTRSFAGLSHTPFSPECASVLMSELDPSDVEIKPDGIVYLPEIKYRRILNKAFGPGGWGLAPRGETIVTAKLVTREYGLVCGGRLVSIARGEMTFFDPDGIPTATEGCKSNALMRCCKDLGVASELWDPKWIRRFLSQHGKEVFVENVSTKKRRKHWMRKDDVLKYPWKEVSSTKY